MKLIKKKISCNNQPRSLSARIMDTVLEYSWLEPEDFPTESPRPLPVPVDIALETVTPKVSRPVCEE